MQNIAAGIHALAAPMIQALSDTFANPKNCAAIEKAAGMLESTDEPIKNIADECGFSTPVFFAREFKQHFNSSPSFYRKQNRSTPR